jgi:hypothetical protein
MKAKPPITAISAANQGQDAEASVGASGASVAGAKVENPGCGAGVVVTSSGCEGVTCGGLAVASDSARALLSRDDGGAVRGAASSVRVGAAGAESDESVSLLTGPAGVGVAGRALASDGRSAGRVTVPCKLKSRSCAGPTVSDEGGGAAVTSTGASLFWAAAGMAAASRSAMAALQRDFDIMRRKAVILPRPVGCWMRPRLPRRRAPRLLARNIGQYKHFRPDQGLNVRRPAPIPRRPPPRS